MVQGERRGNDGIMKQLKMFTVVSLLMALPAVAMAGACPCGSDCPCGDCPCGK